MTTILQISRAVLKHSSPHVNQVKISQDELVHISDDYSHFTKPAQFRTGFFLLWTSETLEILVLLTTTIVYTKYIPEYLYHL